MRLIGWNVLYSVNSFSLAVHFSNTKVFVKLMMLVSPRRQIYEVLLQDFVY